MYQQFYLKCIYVFQIYLYISFQSQNELLHLKYHYLLQIKFQYEQKGTVKACLKHTGQELLYSPADKLE